MPKILRKINFCLTSLNNNSTRNGPVKFESWESANQD